MLKALWALLVTALISTVVLLVLYLKIQTDANPPEGSVKLVSDNSRYKITEINEAFLKESLDARNIWGIDKVLWYNDNLKNVESATLKHLVIHFINRPITETYMTKSSIINNKKEIVYSSSFLHFNRVTQTGDLIIYINTDYFKTLPNSDLGRAFSFEVLNAFLSMTKPSLNYVIDQKIQDDYLNQLSDLPNNKFVTIIEK